jgi:hypothetical protein
MLFAAISIAGGNSATMQNPAMRELIPALS